MGLNYQQQLLASIRNNNNMMQNKTVQSVFDCLDKKDHNNLVQIYKNTCTTLGQEPNRMFLN